MSLELLCFTTLPRHARAVGRAPGAAVVIDWERAGKEERQLGADTCISSDTLADLVAVRSATPGRIVCRINGVGPWTAEEVEDAVVAGASELLVPMVRQPEELDTVIACARGRIRVGFLIETEEAVARAAELARRPVSRVYVGLNDLAIARGSRSIFDALVDGLVEEVRDAVGGMPFGVCGLTLPGGGAPVPTRLLLGEIVRLGCDFTFLRRSFWRDVGEGDPAAAIADIRRAAAAAARRSPATVAADRAELRARLAPLSHPPALVK